MDGGQWTQASRNCYNLRVRRNTIQVHGGSVGFIEMIYGVLKPIRIV
ncbi:hypothetical protein Hanom_Chr12g01120691 [Helianthus anomalus]